jgi:hypothetical protein
MGTRRKEGELRPGEWGIRTLEQDGVREASLFINSRR